MTQKNEELITVNKKALREVLSALNGPAHYVRELQAIRNLGDSPIDLLIEQYNQGGADCDEQ